MTEKEDLWSFLGRCMFRYYEIWVHHLLFRLFSFPSVLHSFGL
jgi:hypothetical protein